AAAALEAAHIQPYSENSSCRVTNGVLLRADIHTLFDLNLLGIEPSSLKIVLAPDLRRTCFVELHGTKLALPDDARLHPNTNMLGHRMQRYKTPPKNSKKGGTTNIRNHKNIKECLAQGKPVEVFVLPDNGLLQYGGFHINLAAGLEDSLVRELKPAWNGGMK